ncbi:MAG TPA: alpha-amylase family glycosyl hydrolase [Steroidobacteraceae bacterium]|jgi:alpha-glucosidase|nr:alpha-amylase family glycosyl hydrolase [Steroidobacteraceae bacterium]
MHWWQSGVVYQIYPRSFQDSNGDGVGDLPGIIARLDYLVELGVTAVWISPIYPSPMADFGYDVADYCNIDPVFGTLADFDQLVAELHRRDLKLILDFVPNHTSIEHEWFNASRSSRRDPKRDWYIWRDPAPNGGPPTNWLSEFGGPAWSWDTATEQYYYHAFLADQPDLNWRNPQVQAAMFDVMRFWLARGVDGFRVDAIHMLFESEQLIDNPPNPAWTRQKSPARRLLRRYSADQPETHAMIGKMRRVADEFADRVLIGEANLPYDRLMLYYGESLGGFHLPFNFQLLRTPWQALPIGALIRQYEAALPTGGWPNWVLGNHDLSRLLNRVGSAAQARVAAMLLLTLRGTPTIYYGEELGMRDVKIPPGSVRDPWERNVPGLGLGRDPCRTPMCWTSQPGAGFTSGVPWLPLGEEFAQVNVADEHNDRASFLALYCALLTLRRAEPALNVGSYREISVDPQLLVYERAAGTRRLLVALNFSDTPCPWPPREGAFRVLLSTRDANPARAAMTALAAHEGIVAEL